MPGVYRTQVNDVLLAALGRALSAAGPAATACVVDLEGHGREDLFDGVDISRTVGWFTSIFPVSLDDRRRLGPGRSRPSRNSCGAMPHRGISYGALRYLAGSVPAIEPAVSFNYLGQFDASKWRCTRATLPPIRRRAHLLDVVAGASRTAAWSSPGSTRRTGTREATVERCWPLRCARRCCEIIEHCAQPGVGGRTPSDFPLAGLDQSTVDRLVGDGRTVEDIYPLTPTQAGMVFHRLVENGQGAYFQQVDLRLDASRP